MERTGFNRGRFIIIITVILAFALRAAAAFPISQLHNDEVGQYLEQAHRLVFGYGHIPWEYRVEMRSWLMPLLLVGPMKMGGILSPDTIAYIYWPKLLVAACSLSILWAAWRFGRAVSITHAWVAFFVAAFWYEFSFFGAHAITEPMAVAAILPAAALLLTGQPQRRDLVIGGFLLCIGVILRFHYGPAVAMIGVFALWGHIRERIGFLVIGGLVAVATSSLVDIAFGQIPFQWIVTNFEYNIVHDVASRYGVSPFNGYLSEYIRHWGWALFLILLCIIPAIKYYPGLFCAAILNLLVHSLIGHKEYRFIYFTTAIFIMLAAIGTVEIAKWIIQRFAPKVPSWAVFAVIPLWIGTSATLAATEPRSDNWTNLNASMALTSKAGRIAGTCGFAFEYSDFWTSGAFAALHRNVPFYLEKAFDPAISKTGVPLKASAGYNSAVGPETMETILPKTYQKLECRAPGGEKASSVYAPGTTRICLFHRPGPCNSQGLDRYRSQNILEELGA